ncbi:hypothetical protein ACFLV5_04040, partial [Chloroflexota bacterium]
CFYSGYAVQIEREGFSTPPFVMDMVTGIAEGQMERSVDLAPEEREQAIVEFAEHFEQQVKDWIEPYQKFIPIVMAVMLLGLLMTIVSLLSWLPILVLGGIFAMLATCHVTRVVAETQEVRRITID